MSLFRRFRDGALCIALLAIPFFFLNASLKQPGAIGPVDRFLLRVAAPLQYVSAQAAHGVGSVLEEYLHTGDVARDRERMGGEVARLRQENAQLQAEAAENRRLRALLDLRDSTHGATLGARVIGKEVSQFFRVVRLRLDRGADDAVRPGTPVLSSEGLVGQVQRVVGRYSDVTLAADPESRVDVVVRRTGARGIVRGTGETTRYACLLEYLGGAGQTQVGDDLYTSGYGQRFPQGILVGRVTKVVSRERGRTQDVEVTPAVDFGRLEHVLLLTEGPSEPRGEPPAAAERTSGSP